MVRVGVCIVAYGLLMGFRNEFEQFWVRNVIAGCAGAFLGMALYEGQKCWRRKE